MDCGAGVWREFASFFPPNGSDHSRAWSLFPFRQLARACHRYASSTRSSGDSNCLGSAANSAIACFSGPVIPIAAHCLCGRCSPYAQRRSVSDGFPPPAVGHLFDRFLSGSAGMQGPRGKEAACLLPRCVGSVRGFLWFSAVSKPMATDFHLCQKVLSGGSHRHLHQPQSFCGLVGNDAAIYSRPGFAPSAHSASSCAWGSAAPRRLVCIGAAPPSILALCGCYDFPCLHLSALPDGVNFRPLFYHCCSSVCQHFLVLAADPGLSRHSVFPWRHRTCCLDRKRSGDHPP